MDRRTSTEADLIMLLLLIISTNEGDCKTTFVSSTELAAEFFPAREELFSHVAGLACMERAHG